MTKTFTTKQLVKELRECINAYSAWETFMLHVFASYSVIEPKARDAWVDRFANDWADDNPGSRQKVERSRAKAVAEVMQFLNVSGIKTMCEALAGCGGYWRALASTCSTMRSQNKKMLAKNKEFPDTETRIAYALEGRAESTKGKKGRKKAKKARKFADLKKEALECLALMTKHKQSSPAGLKDIKALADKLATID